MEHWSHSHSEMSESLHDDVELILGGLSADISKKEKLFANERDRLQRDVASAKATYQYVERETMKVCLSVPVDMTCTGKSKDG